MNEFMSWLTKVAIVNLFITIPLYLVTSIIVNKVFKYKRNISLIILGFDFGLLILLIILLNGSLTMVDTFTTFLEILLFAWVGNVLYFKRRKLEIIKDDEKVGDKFRNWKKPTVLLVLLFLAMMFRWNVDKSTVDNAVVKYRKDRWNGSVYSEIMSKTSYERKIIQRPTIKVNWGSSENLTVIWGVFVGGCAIWLLYSLSKPREKESKDGLNHFSTVKGEDFE